MRVIFYPLLRDCKYWRPPLRQTPEGQTRPSWTRSRAIFRTEKKKHCFCISVMNKWDFNKHADLLQTSFFFLSSLISAAALLCCLLSFLPSAAAGRHLECCFCLWLILPVGRHTHSDATTVFNMVQSVPNLFKALRVTGFMLLCPNPFWSAERSSKNTHLLSYARFCSKIQTITVYFILIASRGRKKLFIIHINIGFLN